MSYWRQWDSSDLDSWQGKDLANHDEDDTDSDQDQDDTDSDQDDGCPYCSNGCNDCLGVSW